MLLDRMRRHQVDLARETGLTTNKVSRWLKEGKEDTPSLPDGLLVSRYFGVSMEYLADDTMDVEPQKEIDRLTESQRITLQMIENAGITVVDLGNVLMVYGEHKKKSADESARGVIGHDVPTHANGTHADHAPQSHRPSDRKRGGSH